jgi:raffinose/stachyose/melibiose transport system permease protein
MKKIMNNKLAIAIFLVPTLIIFTAIVIYPVISSGYYSLLEWDGINIPEFIGIDNYIELFKTTLFGMSIKNSFILIFLSIFIQIPLAAVLAFALNRGIKGEGAYRSVFFIPVILPSIVIANLWMKIYHPNYGLLNTALRAIGLAPLAQQWLSNSDIAIFAAFTPLVWQYIGYYMLLLYSACKAVSPNLIEAAKIDGATPLQVDLHINIPLIAPMIKVCLIFAAVGSLKTFDLIYILTNGGPAGATEILGTYMYKAIFGSNRYGFGSTIAIWIVIFCFAYTQFFERIFTRLDYSQQKKVRSRRI